MDDTLWACDGGCVSLLKMPFTLESQQTICDREGRHIFLREGASDTLRDLEKRGVFISIASNNLTKPATTALEIFGIKSYFRHPQIYVGKKDEMVKNIITSFAKQGITPDETIFVDDSEDNISEVKRLGVECLCFGKEIVDIREIISYFI
ncbi:MAG: magnesium-dependent phosphatase-1 [Candidatus Methanofastidiosia archaeon]